jgi:putative ABC transport system substrate-binding protein
VSCGLLLTLLGGLVLSVIAAPLAVEGQQVEKVYRIGDLREGAAPPSKAFLDAMRELGWVEGQNFKIERRTADRRDHSVIRRRAFTTAIFLRTEVIGSSLDQDPRLP